MSETQHASAPGVRLALPGEAASIASLQRRTWESQPWAADLLDQIDLDAATKAWENAILRPAMAHFRVLVATSGTVPGSGSPSRIVGFAAIGPSDDPDADEDDILVAEFCLDPAAAGLGHDDRLLNAVADTARADRYARLTWWLNSTDDTLRAWLTDAGWAPDGAHRELGLDADSAHIKQIRLHTDISA